MYLKIQIKYIYIGLKLYMYIVQETITQNLVKSPLAFMTTWIRHGTLSMQAVATSCSFGVSCCTLMIFSISSVLFVIILFPPF